MGMTQAKLEFVFEMARHTTATLRDCESLMRYGATYKRLAEEACNRELTVREERKWKHIRGNIQRTCEGIRDYGALTPVPIFQHDPRGATVKIRVSDGFTNDMGQVGICVPTS